MKVTECECVDCGLPCIYKACHYYNVTRYYCDKCMNEDDNLYYFGHQELCVDCILKQLEKVEHDD